MDGLVLVVGKDPWIFHTFFPVHIAFISLYFSSLYFYQNQLFLATGYKFSKYSSTFECPGCLIYYNDYSSCPSNDWTKKILLSMWMNHKIFKANRLRSTNHKWFEKLREFWYKKLVNQWKKPCTLIVCVDYVILFGFVSPTFLHSLWTNNYFCAHMPVPCFTCKLSAAPGTDFYCKIFNLTPRINVSIHFQIAQFPTITIVLCFVCLPAAQHCIRPVSYDANAGARPPYPTVFTFYVLLLFIWQS